MGDAWEGTSKMVQTWWDTWDKYYGKASEGSIFSCLKYSLYVQKSPCNLLFDDLRYDSGFQTSPIIPFTSEAIKNAWANEEYNINDSRRQINPMPPLSTITLTQPDWLQQELKSISEQVNKKQKSILFIFMFIVILRTIIKTMMIIREKFIIFNKKSLIL